MQNRIFVLIFFLSNLSCGASALHDRELQSMHEDLVHVQEDHDSVRRRLGSLEEHHDSVSSSTTSSSPKQISSFSMPQKSNPVVYLRAGEREDDSYENELEHTEDRPTLRINPFQQELNTPDNEHKQARVDARAMRDFNAAMSLFQAKKFKDASDAWAGFLFQYPDHSSSANAMYWRGESELKLNNFAQAIRQFEALIARFPTHAKVPEALLQIGLAHRKMGALTQAKQTFDRLRKEFPLSETLKHIPASEAP